MRNQCFESPSMQMPGTEQIYFQTMKIAIEMTLVIEKLSEFKDKGNDHDTTASMVKQGPTSFKEKLKVL